jgi:hypothetical protein
MGQIRVSKRKRGDEQRIRDMTALGVLLAGFTGKARRLVSCQS